MKRKSFISSLIILAIINFSAIVLSFTFPQDPENLEGMARVKKRQGIEIYVMCEPVRDYDIVGEVKIVKAVKYVKSRTIEDLVDALLKKAKKEKEVEEDKNLKFDALLTDDGNIGQLIKFTD